MATVNYYYRSNKENATLTVRLTYRHNGNDFVLGANSGIMIYDRNELEKNPKLSGKYYWEKHHNALRLKDIDAINKRAELSITLNKLENKILKSFELITPFHANKEWLEGVVNEFHNPNKENEIPNTLVDFIDYYLKSNTDIKYGTSKKFITLKNKIAERKKLISKSGIILLNEVDDDFKIKFQQVFSDYNINTINRDLTNIKTILRFADRKGKTVNKEVLNWKMKVEKTPFIYLNPDEISLIKNLSELPEHLENARDWLVISCLCGQRVSDFMRFKKSMIKYITNINKKKVPIIEFTQIKTQTLMAVPLVSTIVEILNKRNGEFPRPTSSQKYNDYIKLVCKEAKLTDKIYGSKVIVYEDGRKRTEKGKFEKWELVSSHIGRRSYATNNFDKIPLRLVMNVTGHTTEKMFLNYIQKKQTDLAQTLADYF